jgi:predicted permease
VLRDGGARAGEGRKGSRLRSSLVVVQVAAAFLLTTGGSLMLQTVSNRQRVDLGFNPSGAWRADVVISGARYAGPGRVSATIEDIIGRLQQRPSIQAAGAIAWASSPGAGAQQAISLLASGASLAPAVRRNVEAVTPAYFAAAGIPLRHGRAFIAADRSGATPVAVINEELARHLWPGRSPVGDALRLGPADSAAPIVTIVGVVGTIRRSGMQDLPVARIYVPFAQSPNPSVTFAVRARSDLHAASTDLVSVVRDTDPLFVVEESRAMEDDVAQFVAPVRMIARLLAGFAAAGVLLAALGVFGTMAYVVSQREREIAVRSALGADPARLVWMVVRAGVSMAAIGIVVGLVASIGVARVLGSLLYGVAATDPLTLAGVAAVLVLATLAACYRPARAAARVDPVVLLRQ